MAAHQSLKAYEIAPFTSHQTEARRRVVDIYSFDRTSFLAYNRLTYNFHIKRLRGFQKSKDRAHPRGLNTIIEYFALFSWAGLRSVSERSTTRSFFPFPRVPKEKNTKITLKAAVGVFSLGVLKAHTC
jgi:hypothetical protein